MKRPPDSAETAIIGGGIIGCAIAFHLTRAGSRDVVLLERESLASGATGICPGGIRQQFSSRPECILARRSFRFWDDINAILRPRDPFDFEKSGYLFLAHSPAALASLQEHVRLQNELGIPAGLLTPPEVAHLLPDLELDGVEGASFCAQDGFIEDCHGVTSLLARRASQAGARIVYRKAERIERRRGEWVVTTPGGAMRCSHLVLAAGVESVELARSAGLELPVTRQRRRLAFTLPFVPRVMAPLVVSRERAFAGRQLRNGVFYLGWLEEREGDDDLVFTEKALAAGAGLLPALADLPVRRVLAGEYDNTPDRRPILGPVGDHPGLFVAVGFSGHGFMIAPAVGELLADQIRGQPSDLPARAFGPDRFSASPPAEDLVI